ncbi:hypothetical protein ACPZ19_39270 [Amycolatopsis lurida]
MATPDELDTDVRFTLNGRPFTLNALAVAARLRGRTPEPIHIHWVSVDGVRFPVKQALEIVLEVDRASFTSQSALGCFRRLGLVTSEFTRPPAARRGNRTPWVGVDEAGAAFARLVAFLRRSPLTDGVGALEHALVSADAHRAREVAHDAGLTEELLRSALIVRRDVGQVSDVIHATVIALALPAVLEEGERVVQRPSLGPGNDPARTFDLETNMRVAEFKVAVWSGGDMMRKRGLVADLVHLAMNNRGRRPELWAVGEEPAHFLRTSASPVGELLARSSPHLQRQFAHRYGTAAITLRDFVSRHAGHVQLCDITEVVPEVAEALS